MPLISPQRGAHNGFILIAMMAGLLLLTVLVLGIAESSLFAHRQANLQWQFWQTVTQVEQINQTIAQAPDMHCRVSYTVDDFYWQTAANLWPNTACRTSMNNGMVYSVVELLPQTACLADKKSLQPVLFWRVTSSLQADNGMPIHVQTIITTRDKQQSTCINTAYRVGLGLQTQRME